MRQHHYYVYILTNKNRTVLYRGVTNDLKRRVDEHKEKLFSKGYNLDTLVYFEYFRHIEEAIEREKQIKAVSRQKKEELIISANVAWRDLSTEID